MKRRVMDYILILLYTFFAYCFCTLDLSETHAYYNPYNTPGLPTAYGTQNTTYPTILQTGFSGLGQSLGFGISSFGFPLAPNIGNLFPATSFGIGTYGIYGPGISSLSLLGLDRFSAGSATDLVRVAHPTNFPLILNQDTSPYSILETPEMNYYNLLGLQSMLANPFEYARVNYINSLYQTPYPTPLQYQNPYQVALSNLFFPSYYNPMSTLFGSYYYQNPVTQLLGQYPNPFLIGNPPVMSPDYSTKMYVIGTTDLGDDITVYLIIKDNGEDPPKDPEELAKRAREYVKVEEYNTGYNHNSTPGKTCSICLFREYRGYGLIWAWAEKWWK